MMKALALIRHIRLSHCMVKLVLLHKADSIYEDEPDVVYDFPRVYLRRGQCSGGCRAHAMQSFAQGHPPAGGGV